MTKEKENHVCEVCDGVLEPDKEMLFFLCQTDRCGKKYFRCEQCGYPVDYSEDCIVCECGASYELGYIESKMDLSPEDESEETEEQESEYTKEDLNPYY